MSGVRGRGDVGGWVVREVRDDQLTGGACWSAAERRERARGGRLGSVRCCASCFFHFFSVFFFHFNFSLSFLFDFEFKFSSNYKLAPKFISEY